MSETLSSFEFTKTDTTADIMRTVANEGAVAVHGLMSEGALHRVATVLERAPFVTDDNPHNEKVNRRHDLVKYGFDADLPWPIHAPHAELAPAPVFWAARDIARYVSSDAESSWTPNEIIGHRYEAGHFIDKHRDYRGALGFVAVLTVLGTQQFHFVRDNGEEAEVTMNPGTLTIMRGFQPDTLAPRPKHWVEPAKERRLALSLRQMRVQW